MNNEKIKHNYPRSKNLEKENALLRKENKQGEMIRDIEELKIKTNALVAKNIRAKPDKPDSDIKRKRSKHARTSRKRPVQIDNKTKVDQKSCHICGNKLSKIVHKYTRIVEDIIPARAYNTEYTISRRYCKYCKKTITPKINTALPNERFGIQLAVFLATLKTSGLSYKKISKLLEMVYNIHMNESTINRAVRKTATAFGPLYEQMVEDLKTELNIHGDETSWNITGNNH
ncbi:MAG: Transposase [Cenarchaeum symbiont of Oopsacas minuta]|nr:Transposase [Cenarchaeum symbiont of Oopsacas minuta]